MQTPFEETSSEKVDVRNADWSARSDQARRSIFGNYTNSVSGSRPIATSNPAVDTAGETAADHRFTLQQSIDRAVARSFIHRFLAQAYEDPSPANWAWLQDKQTTASLRAAAAVLGESVSRSAASLIDSLDERNFETFHNAYLAAFGHAARGSCPLNEIEYGDLKADPLFQPHRLADLAAFYRAFGLELAGDADERQDHLCIELEFLCVLAAKEAYALENQLEQSELMFCREAQRKFIRGHLGRWVPAFARRLSAMTEGSLHMLAEFTRVFVEAECGGFGVNPGNEDLLLRPVDEAAENLCASCGISNLPPGATRTT